MNYTLKPKAIPLNETYEVIVVGGGPAGCTAAAASAREGKKTLLIEATSALGGMGTSGLVPAWCPFSDREKMVYRGLAEKVFNDTKAGMRHIKDGSMDWVAIDAERLKRVYDDLVISHGADVLFNTQLSDVDVRDGVVNTIVVSNKEGLSAYRAQVYIDTTGDADLTAFAGGRFAKGDGDAEELQPATHCFLLANVDMYSFPLDTRIHGANPKSPIHQILEDGKYPLIPDGHIIGTIVGPGTVGFNAGHIWKVDNTQPKTVSEALMLGRKLAATFRDALAEYMPQTYGNAHLVSTGALLGIRETRRIEGDYELTVDDYFERKTFSDEIARNSYFIDVHSNAAAAKAKGKLEHYKKGESHGIPYRCLTPKTLKNVLVAGRSISTERLVQGSVRVMPVCLAMGEAAGTAAAFAVDVGGDTRSFDVQALRERLLEHGAYIK